MPLPAPSPLILFGYYLLLCLPLLYHTRPVGRAVAHRRPVPSHLPFLPPRWLLRCTPLAALVLLLFPLPLRFLHASSPTGQARITLLSVGAGQCAVVHLASGKTLLIDAGSSTISDPARTCLIPYLKRFGVARIDSAFISHANHDHLNAIEDTALHLGLHHVYVSPFFHSHAAGNPPAESLLQTLDHLGHLPIVLSAGQRLAIDNTTTPTLDVLWPSTGRALDANNSSLVLRLTVNGRSILFPGDIQEPAQRQLLGRPALLRSDILIAPHHGSSEPTTADLLRVVNPSIILASNDDRLSQKQRNLETLASARRLYRTHRSGAITVVISPDGQMNVDTFLAPR